MLPYYYSVSEYLKDTYGKKLYKLSLSGNMTCPNRDGFLDTRGCIFCSGHGSGDFAVKDIDKAKTLVSNKYSGSEYIAYSQSFTNTYADAQYLRELFMPVILRDDIRILSIATRPDCLGDDILELLDELNHIKPVWIELGLQTINDSSSDYIRRGYPLSTYYEAVKNLLSIGIAPIVHMIIGLPHETISDYIATARYIADSGASGIKISLLHILKDTDLYDDYCKGLFKALTMEEYLAAIGAILPALPKNMVIHRLTGDGPKNILAAPLWTADKKRVLNTLTHYLKENIMNTDSTTLYKLMILYMLSKVNFPLSNTQLSSFMLDKQYTDYFTFQETINSLVEDGFIRGYTHQSSTHYTLTKEGEDTIAFFYTKISTAIRDDIETYLFDNKYELKNEAGTVTDCYKLSNGNYIAHCQLKEGDTTLIELNLNVPVEEQAEIICARWRENSQEVYDYIVRKLM